MTRTTLYINNEQLFVRPYKRFWQRFIGLMGRKTLPSNQGIVLSPCQDVHSFFMRFSLCVLHCDKEGRLLKYVPCLKPWSWSLCPDSHYVFEFNVGCFSNPEQARQWLNAYFTQTNQECTEALK